MSHATDDWYVVLHFLLLNGHIGVMICHILLSRERLSFCCRTRVSSSRGSGCTVSLVGNQKNFKLTGTWFDALFWRNMTCKSYRSEFSISMKTERVQNIITDVILMWDWRNCGSGQRWGRRNLVDAVLILGQHIWYRIARKFHILGSQKRSKEWKLR